MNAKEYITNRWKTMKDFPMIEPMSYMCEEYHQAKLEEITEGKIEEMANEYDKGDITDDLGKVLTGHKAFKEGAKTLLKFLIKKSKEEPKVEVFRREECIFQYCPNPELCKNKCQSPMIDFEKKTKENDNIINKMNDFSNFDMNEPYGDRKEEQ